MTYQDETASVPLPYDDWPSWQLPLAIYAMKMSSIASISGSSYIIYQVLALGKNRSSDGGRQLGKFYHRIMLCLSSFDIIGSFGLFIGSWMIPADVVENFHYENIGTVTTCDIAGFMVHIGQL